MSTTLDVRPRPDRATTKPPRSSIAIRRRRQAWVAWAFIAPFILLFLCFRLIPAFSGAVLSVGEWSLAGSYEFTGTANFERLFQDSIFWGALRVSLIYAVIAIPMGVGASVLLAVLANQKLRAIAFYRAMFFLPVVTSAVMSGIIWIWIFGANGPLNAMLGAVGLPGVGWLSTDYVVLFSLAVVSTWMNAGYNMFILLAGLLAIPEEYYEAARVDGASGWQIFWKITVPLLKPALLFILVLETIRALQLFDTIYVMTGGGPVRASYALSYMIYDVAFGQFDFGYASAMGVVVLAITLVLSLLQRRAMEGRKEKA